MSVSLADVNTPRVRDFSHALAPSHPQPVADVTPPDARGAALAAPVRGRGGRQAEGPLEAQAQGPRQLCDAARQGRVA
mgnify:CR=1 FL=1